MEETNISTPVETASVDTSSTVEPSTVETEAVETVEDTSTEEPTGEVAAAETETEPTLYAGKYKSVDDLVNGYKEAEKSVQRAKELEKQLTELQKQKEDEVVRIQQEQLKQAQARGFNTVEQQQIADQVTLAEFDLYANNINSIAPEHYETVRQNLINYYETANTAYLDEAKRYFDSNFIGKVAVEMDRLEHRLTKEAKQKAENVKSENMRKLADELKTDYAEFLSDLDNNEGKAEALRAFCNTGSISSKEDMAVFQTIYNKIVDFAKEQAIKEYEAQKTIEATKQASQIEANSDHTESTDGIPSYNEFMSMSREDYNRAVEKYGLTAIMNAK